VTAVRGACPDVFAPMATGDGLLARIKPPESRLPAPMARAIADAARRFGNGAIELTARANLQLRGVALANAAPLARAMVACGAALAQPEAERRRNLIVSPLAGADPGVRGDPVALARAIAPCLAAGPPLPAKFGIVVDGGGVLPLVGIAADIRVEGGVDRCRVLDAHGATDCAAEAVPDIVAALARHSGARPTTALIPPPRAVGFIGYGSAGLGALGVAAQFGRLDAEMLAALADLAEECADGLLRLTPWRRVLLAGVTRAQAATMAAKAAALGFIVDPADPRLAVTACAGAPACAQALAPARADAARLLAVLPTPPSVHIAGCAKLCARPAGARFVLTGTASGYDLARNGETIARGLDLAGCARRIVEAA
jgi:precorrin-3B synthase